MSHFSDEAWADFARGLDQSRNHTSIQKHLLQGCEDCAQTGKSWSMLRQIAAAERDYVVPEETVRLVKAQFQAMHRLRADHWTLGTLVFDSVMRPAMAGVRSGGVSARQVVYEAEGLTVDMRFDRQSRSHRVVIVGQVLARGASQPPLQDATVILWTEKGDPIMAVKTTTFGEFQLEFEPQDHLRLSIEGSGRRPIRIPLANLKESDC